MSFLDPFWNLFKTHQHKWVKFEEFTRTTGSGTLKRTIGTTYVMQCAGCGILKNHYVGL